MRTTEYQCLFAPFPNIEYLRFVFSSIPLLFFFVACHDDRYEAPEIEEGESCFQHRRTLPPPTPFACPFSPYQLATALCLPFRCQLYSYDSAAPCLSVLSYLLPIDSPPLGFETVTCGSALKLKHKVCWSLLALRCTIYIYIYIYTLLVHCDV